MAVIAVAVSLYEYHNGSQLTRSLSPSPSNYTSPSASPLLTLSRCTPLCSSPFWVPPLPPPLFLLLLWSPPLLLHLSRMICSRLILIQFDCCKISSSHIMANVINVTQSFFFSFFPFLSKGEGFGSQWHIDTTQSMDTVYALTKPFSGTNAMLNLHRVWISVVNSKFRWPWNHVFGSGYCISIPLEWHFERLEPFWWPWNDSFRKCMIFNYLSFKQIMLCR